MCQKHYCRWRKTGTAQPRDRMAIKWAYIRSRLPEGDPVECWPWEGRINCDGYGVMHVRGLTSLVHRLAYQDAIGAIPDGLTIDHVCHRPEDCKGGRTCPHRRCCNPAHLEVATLGANGLRGNSPQGINSRKTQCDQGHKFTPENTYYPSTGGRQCVTCRRENDRKAVARRRERRAA